MLFSTVFLALTASAAHAAPLTLNKRIQQTIADSTAKWEQACLAAGGGLKCNPQSVTSFTTLLAAAGPCEQQDAADSMIQLAQSLNNDPEMIRLTQIFAQQPRNTPNSVSVPYCQKAPASPLLAGLFQCQFQGASPTTFVGSLSVGAAGTVPFGLKSLSPLGSCKANPSGPIADGTQLVDLVQDPGVSSANGIDSTPASSVTPETSVAAPATSSSTPETSSVAVPATSTAVAPPAAISTADFHLQNGLDAQKLNAQFKSLTATSSCTEGQQACVGGSFAQCVSGSFVLTPCAAGTVCAALPLVNKPGTSITCDTTGDVADRIAATGATGGVDGSASASSTSSTSSEEAAADPDSDSDCEDESGSSAETAATSTAAAPSPTASDFHAANGLQAQTLNAKFKTLTASATCTEGEQACIGTSFAQCVSGSFVLTPCSGGLVCAALPLVNKPGTSIACDTLADVQARISASGVAGGIAGL
ncbi:hypothetical protein DFH08DRAFT_925775 [Mycena albidolilacea]|uniref:Carbohydrate-binding module family 19 domain-containing protein n=1 Tax=Mycena albidolilacea TaxID=1033008 RepID=A0AAD6ZPZ7_9AGAR|nr:hypothetical protein DFH08DRAFT_925775 [Mycena albidolilacea]